MTDTNDRLALEFISVLGMPPVEYVELAADLGLRRIGIALEPGGENPHDYPAWSLRTDMALRRDFKTALADHGIALSIGEGFLAWPNTPISALQADLDIIAELGVPVANIASIEPDFDRACVELAGFATLVAERGMTATLEFLPGLPIVTLAQAVEAAHRVGHPALRLLIDFMHIFRAGGSVAELAALDPALVGYIQLCDVPLVSPGMSYVHEARHERLPPGEGELPLLDALRALPRDRIVGLEVPMVSRARAGQQPRERLADTVATARTMLAALDVGR